MSEWQQDREACERATEGPWRARITHQYLCQGVVDQRDGGPLNGTMPLADAEFIAAARTRWPAALDRIAALEAERDAAYSRGVARVVREVEDYFTLTSGGYWSHEELLRKLRAIAPKVMP